MSCVSPCLRGVTLVGTKDPLNKLILLVLSEPGSVLGPVDTGSVERKRWPGGSSGPVSTSYSHS